MSFWSNIGNTFSTIGQGVWNEIGEYGGAIGGAIGSWLGGQTGSQIGGQIGSGIQQIANPQAPQSGIPLGSQQQPTYRKAGMCFIATECYAEVPQKFYDLRNRLPSFLVKAYYKISPYTIPIIRFTHSHKFVKTVLNILVKR